MNLDLVINTQPTLDYVHSSPNVMIRLYRISDEFFTEYVYDPAEFIHLVIPSLGTFLRDILEYYTLMCNYCDQIPCTDAQTMETALSMIVPISRLA